MSSRAPTRKQLRKEKRKQKKARRNEYFSRGKHPKEPLPDKTIQNAQSKKPEQKPEQKAKKSSNNKDPLNIFNHERKKEMEEIKVLKRNMAAQRKKQLLLANEEEDRNIKRLEKQLKLNKRKSKGLPKMFVESGLDYILDMCDPEQMKAIAAVEKKFTNMDDEFAEDLALITGKSKTTSKNKKSSVKNGKNNKKASEDEESMDDAEFSDDYDIMSEDFSDGEEEVSDQDTVSDKQSVISSRKKRKNEKILEKGGKKVKIDKRVRYDESENDNDYEDEESDLEDGEGSEIDNEGDSEIDNEEDSEVENGEDSEMENEKDSYIEEEENQKEIRVTNGKFVRNKKLKEGKNTRKVKILENDDTDYDDILLESEEEIEDEEGREEFEDEETDMQEEESEMEYEINTKKNGKNDQIKERVRNRNGNKNKIDIAENFEDLEEEMEDSGEESEMDTPGNIPQIKGAAKVNPDGTWEDIYGRVHARNGSLLNKSNQKYIPPAARAKMNQDATENKEALEKLNRLKKQIKGLLNRLAISNMHNIAKQIENLYMSNSRNDMNETLGNLINESIISVVLTPERLLMEHILLIAVLHANIGTEVGAHFLQVLVSQFDKKVKNSCEVEDKTLDNIVIALAQMYNFKIFDSKLMHEILNELGSEFTEKNVDCILHVLRNIGFVLRKDDPIALKNFILESNKKAAAVTTNAVSGSRLRFLLDVLTAIKNNNITKIPNYDDSYSEHLKKIMKSFVRKGNYVTQLNISLEDLLKADEKGKWWVVGSAWTGNSENREKSKKKERTQKFSEELLAMAKKLRMNTDTRRDIFCVIMSSDGYEDAFEKLMHLGLTKNQERDIIHVILHCCVKEYPFNPYYGYLAQKFCETDRKHMLTLKYSIWDKLKALEKQSANCLTSLASLLMHLFLNQGLPISTLKVIQFAQMDATITRFLRQIFLGILLHHDTEACLGVFKNVAQSAKLKMFRESLRLFLQLFVRKNLESDKIDEKQREMLKTRSKMIERLLVVRDTLNLYD